MSGPSESEGNGSPIDINIEQSSQESDRGPNPLDTSDGNEEEKEVDLQDDVSKRRVQDKMKVAGLSPKKKVNIEVIGKVKPIKNIEVEEIKLDEIKLRKVTVEKKAPPKSEKLSFQLRHHAFEPEPKYETVSKYKVSKFSPLTFSNFRVS